MRERERERVEVEESKERYACVVCMWFYMVRGMKDMKGRRIFLKYSLRTLEDVLFFKIIYFIFYSTCNIYTIAVHVHVHTELRIHL